MKKGTYDDLMETLTKSKEVGFLEDYKTQIDNLVIDVLGLSESYK
jgi:hypothetical protein